MARLVTFGEVMMRLTPPGRKKLLQTDNLTITYGGAEANVSCALAHWGLESAHVTSFPNNALGDAAIATLRKLNVSTEFMIKQEGRLGLYFVEAGAMNRATAITYDRLPSAFSAIHAKTFDWEKILEGAEWFHWTGITPAISQGAADSLMEALNVAEKKGIHISADINYRMGLWQYGKTPGDVLAPLVEKSSVVVAAASDTESIFGITADNYADLAKLMKQRFPKMKIMLASRRTSVSADHNTLSGILWNGNEVIESRTHDIDNIVDRIGSGDSFISGFIYGHFNNYSHQDKIDFAAAAAVLKHSIEGDHNLASVTEIRNLMSGETGGRVKR
ncbi:MAG: PfkB family carbohydrate kinase [Sphingobacteriales bacterium]|jgi:2-dehydro-3-deoxygluconokinase